MKIINRVESRERCVEAGWVAFDYYIDGVTTREFVLSLRSLGSFILMDKLKKPFFKIEADYYVIKGVLDQEFFRVAIHGGSLELLSKIETLIEG
ncbi:MAG: hypothetical protein LUC37_04720 [Prevotella sp.]|nr:hypothetical protein [Prevotella sp.]